VLRSTVTAVQVTVEQKNIVADPGCSANRAFEQREGPETPKPHGGKPVVLWRRTAELGRMTLAGLALALALGCAVIAIAEVSSRQTIGGLLNDLERELAQRFAASAQEQDTVARMAREVTQEARVASASPAATPSNAGARTDVRALQLAHLVAGEGMRTDSAEEELKRIIQFRRRLQQLELTGGAESQSTASTLMAELAREQRAQEILGPMLDDLDSVGPAVHNFLGWLTELESLPVTDGVGNALFVMSNSPYGASDLTGPLTSADTHWRQARSRLVPIDDAELSKDIETTLQRLRDNAAALDGHLEKVRTAGRDAATEFDSPPSDSKVRALSSVRELRSDTGESLRLSIDLLRRALSQVLGDTAQLRIYLGALSSRPPPKDALTAALEHVALARTTVLLAIAMVCCGLIGALIGGIRTPRELRGSSAMLGMAAAFVAFLAIRGGKAVLVAEAAGQQPLLNPYSFAFLGLLAGLFTDRAHGLLAYLVDQLIDRIKSIATQPAQAAPAPAPALLRKADPLDPEPATDSGRRAVAAGNGVLPNPDPMAPRVAAGQDTGR
jgi:hypothetical protein